MRDGLLVGKIVVLMFTPFQSICWYELDDDGSAEDEDDALLWTRDLEKHSHDEFSITMVQANEVLKDPSQVETGRHATFVGVYDDDGGCEAAKYICDQVMLVANFLW
ncbi:Protein phosphatase 2C family protein [Perilla frutescens var. frutescens]|nr:Protein phosphatase 2C family protein [Perilla frutescens var. frutescens]